jgi:hypothetical protein
MQLKKLHSRRLSSAGVKRLRLARLQHNKPMRHEL